MLLLRSGRKNRWISEYDWLNEDEVVADVYADFKTDEGKLSLWRIPEDLSNLERICAAIAAKKQKVDKLDIFWFDEQVLKAYGVKSVSTPGDTHDAEINKFHINIIELTTEKLYKLSDAVNSEVRSNQYIKRFTPKEVKKLLRDALSNGYFDETDLNDKIRSDLSVATT